MKEKKSNSNVYFTMSYKDALEAMVAIEGRMAYMEGFRDAKGIIVADLDENDPLCKLAEAIEVGIDRRDERLRGEIKQAAEKKAMSNEKVENEKSNLPQ